MAALGLGAVACATTEQLAPPPSPAQVTAAEAAVRTAREGKPEEQSGPVGQHLRLAEKELAEAKERITRGDNRSAGLLLARAEADAELSQVLRRRERAIAEAEVIEAQLKETRASQPKGSEAPPSPTP